MPKVDRNIETTICLDMVFFLIKYKNHMNIILILTVALVVILLIYYLSKPRDIPRQKTQLQPKPQSLPPVGRCRYFLMMIPLK